MQWSDNILLLLEKKFNQKLYTDQGTENYSIDQRREINANA